MLKTSVFTTAGFLFLALLMCLAILLVIATGCPPDDDDDDDNDDDTGGDDDDDDNDDDDDDDDNDDDNDDDDDNNDNDDNNDDDNNDNDNNDDDDITANFQNVTYHGYAYGIPSLAIASDGGIFVAMNEAHSVCVWRQADGVSELHSMLDYASNPSLAVDSAGVLHMAFVDPRDFAAGYATYADGAWTVLQRFDQGDWAGRIGLAIDENDRPRILFSLAAGWTLRYAAYDGAAWTMETVASDVDINEIHMQTSGTDVHAVFRTYREAYYAFRDACGWSVETVDESATTAGLAVDDAGVPHVAIGMQEPARLAYLTPEDKAWRKEIAFTYGPPDTTMKSAGIGLAANGQPMLLGVEATLPPWKGTNKTAFYFVRRQPDGTWVEGPHSPFGYDSDMTVRQDEAHNLYVAAMEERPIDLTLTVWDGAEWTHESVQEGDLINRVAATVAPDNSIHFVGFNNDDYEVFHITQVDEEWVSETAYDDTTWSESIHLVADAGGFLHVTHYQPGGDGLEYLTNVSGSWVNEALEPPNRCNVSDLAVDSTGRVHVACRNGGQPDDLYYLVQTEDGWATELVWEAVGVSGGLAIAVDNDDHPHLMVHYNPDGQNERMIYAVRDDDSWSFQVVDWDVEGATTDLALDSNGAAHLAYWDMADNPSRLQLVYATNRSGSWVSESVMENETNTGVTFALDAAGNAHFLYTYMDVTTYATNATGSWEHVDLFPFSAKNLAVLIADQIYLAYTEYAAIWIGQAPEISGRRF